MGIFRTNDPTQFDDIDGIIIDEVTPVSSVRGVAANLGILVGKFQRGPEGLPISPIGSIGDFLETYGKSSYSGNKQLKNKAFGQLKIVRVTASDAAKASLALDGKIQFDAKFKGAYGNNITVAIENASDDLVGPDTPAVAASFDAAVGGVTGNVQLSALTAGVAGNSILLTGDGVADLATLVADWNVANPANMVSLTSANGADVPANAEAMQLAGGVDLIPGTVTTEGGVKIIIADTNPGAILPTEVYDNIKIAEITPTTFIGSALVDVIVVSSASEPATSVAAPLAGGTDGTVADTDYEAAIAFAEQERAGNVLFLDEYNTARNQMLKTHAGIAQDKMVILAGGENDDEDAMITMAGGLRDSDGNIILAWPWVETRIDGVLEYTSPASWVASIFTQVSPHIALSFNQNTKFLGGITDLKYKVGRNKHIALDNAGVLAFELDSDVGFVIKNAVTTQILNSQKKEILRRRMAYFLEDSIALFLKNYQNGVNAASKRDEVKSQILEFDSRLVRDGIVPGNNEISEGEVVQVDVESLNTAAVIAQGMFKILYRRRIYSSMRYIVLQADIGTGVVVTDVSN